VPVYVVIIVLKTIITVQGKLVQELRDASYKIWCRAEHYDLAQQHKPHTQQDITIYNIHTGSGHRG
jgi:hypothetical protein